jgi:hypothetical protein
VVKAYRLALCAKNRAPVASGAKALHHFSFRNTAPSEMLSVGAFFIFALYLQYFSLFPASREQDLPHHIFARFGHIFHGISLFSPIDQD